MGHAIAELRRAAWWRSWRLADFTWEGLAKRPLPGWRWSVADAVIVPAAQAAASDTVSATHQHYWWDQRDSLVSNAATGESYTVVHLPLVWADGSRTDKASHRDGAMAAVEQRLRSASQSEVVLDPVPRSVGADGRAHLMGAVIPSTPYPAGGNRGTVSADFSHAFFMDGVKWNEGITLQECDFTLAAFGGAAGFRKARSQGSVARFQDACFFSDADFDGIDFSNVTRFDRAFFAAWARFEGARFRHTAWFEDAVVIADALFGGATFDADSRSDRIAIGGMARFDRAIFKRRAAFADAVFAGDLNLPAAEIFGRADFRGARLGGSLNLDDALFRDDADFSSGLGRTADPTSSLELIEVGDADGRRWVGHVGGAGGLPSAPADTIGDLSARRARFLGDLSFDRRHIEASLDLSHSTFAGIPYFHGARLPQRTSVFEAAFTVLNPRKAWVGTRGGRGREGPNGGPVSAAVAASKLKEPVAYDQGARLSDNRPTLDDARLESAEAAFRTLKFAMESIRAYRMESLFFKLELRARRLRKHDSQVPAWERFASQCYGLLSDYGDSIIRPLTALVVSWAVFGAAYWLLQPLATDSPLSLQTVGDALQHSLGRAAIVGGYSGEDRAWDWYSAWANRGSMLSWAGAMRLASMIQSVFSVIMVFLAALALRRKFRIT